MTLGELHHANHGHRSHVVWTFSNPLLIRELGLVQFVLPDENLTQRVICLNQGWIEFHRSAQSGFRFRQVARHAVGAAGEQLQRSVLVDLRKLFVERLHCAVASLFSEIDVDQRSQDVHRVWLNVQRLGKRRPRRREVALSLVDATWSASTEAEVGAARRSTSSSEAAPFTSPEANSAFARLIREVRLVGDRATA
jgi:hypothetical protein